MFDWDKIVNLAWDIASGTLNETLSNGAIVTGDTSASSQAAAYSKGWFRPGNSPSNQECRINVMQNSNIVISADVTLLQLGYSNEMFIYLFGSTEFTDATKDSLILNQKIRVNRMYRNVPKGTYYPVFTLSSNKVKIENIQIEQNTVATDYVEHKEQTFTFPLGNEKLMLGDYLADDGIHKNRKKIVLDGTSGNKFSSFSTGANNRGAIAAFSDIKKGVDFRYNTALCTNFAYVPNVYFDSGDTEGFIVDSTGTIYVRFGSQSEINTLAKANQWLANTLPELEYELAEETIIPYTSAQQEVYNQIKQALSYEEQTNVSGFSTKVSPKFEVKAFRDMNATVENLQARIDLLNN